MLLNFNPPKLEKMSVFDPRYTEDYNDNHIWKGKHIKDKDERIEIRKPLGQAQMLIVVYKNPKFTAWDVNRDEWYENHGDVRISMNAKSDLTFKDLNDLNQVINEAREILEN